MGEYAHYYTDGWPLDHIESSDTSVAVIENNQIKGVGAGTVDITFYSSSGGHNTCKLTVSVPVVNYLGDVDRNGAVNAVDASYVLTEYANSSTKKQSELDAEQKAAADADKNGAVNAVDASYILSYYAYTSTSTGEKDVFEDYMKKQ